MFETDDPRNSAAAAPAIKKEAIACVALLAKFDVDEAAQRFTSAVEAQSDEFQRCAFTSDAQASRSGAKKLFSFVYHESRDTYRTDEGHLLTLMSWYPPNRGKLKLSSPIGNLLYHDFLP